MIMAQVQNLEAYCNKVNDAIKKLTDQLTIKQEENEANIGK